MQNQRRREDDSARSAIPLVVLNSIRGALALPSTLPLIAKYMMVQTNAIIEPEQVKNEALVCGAYASDVSLALPKKH